MDRLFRSSSFVSSRTSIPPDIINEDDHTVEEIDFPDFHIYIYIYMQEYFFLKKGAPFQTEICVKIAKEDQLNQSCVSFLI